MFYPAIILCYTIILENNGIYTIIAYVCLTDGLDAAAHSAVEKRARYRQRSNSVGKRRSRAGSFKKIREELESEVCICVCTHIHVSLCVCTCVRVYAYIYMQFVCVYQCMCVYMCVYVKCTHLFICILYVHNEHTIGWILMYIT